MATPLMTEVFLHEASMRAWTQLGFSPEAKAAFEQELGRDAYEQALALLPMIARGVNFGGVDPRASAARAVEYLGHESVDREVALTQEHLKSSKFRSRLRSSAQEIVSLCSRGETGRAFDLIAGIVAEFPPEAPAGYSGRVALDLGTGWTWVHLEDRACRGHEGKLMQHCGSSIGDMYSLRDPRGKPHATIEVIRNPAGEDSGPLHYDQGISQIKGKQNQPPAEKYWPMIKRFVDELPPSLRTVQEWDKEWSELRGYLGQDTASAGDDRVEDELDDDY